MPKAVLLPPEVVAWSASSPARVLLLASEMPDNDVMSALAPLAAAPRLVRAAAAVLAPVPPLATGTVPVSETLGFCPPDDASGALAPTESTPLLLMVPLVAIIPPLKPVPAVIDVTVPGVNARLLCWIVPLAMLLELTQPVQLKPLALPAVGA